MPKRNLDPSNPDVIARMEARIRRMTPEEALAYLKYRTAGVEETDMTGRFSHGPTPKRTMRERQRAVSV